MNFDINQIDNALILCPTDYKERMLESFNAKKIIKNINFSTLEEYRKNCLFGYGVKAINYLVNKGFSVDNAKEILNNLIYIEEKEYNNTKLDNLVKYKKELDANGLLEYNKDYKKYLNSKNLVIIGYGKLNNFDKSILIGKSINIIEEEYKEKNYDIYEFNNIEEEVEFVYNSIYDLLEKDIDINNIYVVNANEDYQSYFKRFNDYYGFSINYNENKNFYGTQIINEFINMLDNKSKNEIYDYLANSNSQLSNKLINILNKYVEFDLNEAEKLILSDIKNINVNKKYINVVNCVDVKNNFSDDDYVFFVGLNDTVPTIKKDTEYITDNIKHLLNLQTTNQINELNKENLINHISNIKNIVLTYSINTPFNTYNKQHLIGDNNCRYIQISQEYEYSDKLNKARYADKLDKLRKFNSINNNVDVLYNTYGKNKYLSYDNRFNELNKNQINNLVKQINKNNNQKLSLAYSSMNEYNECAFKYYLNHVLKISEPFGTYYTKLGTVCHGVLRDLYEDENFEFEKSWEKQIKLEESKENKNIFNDSCERYFVNKIKNELKNDIEVVKKQKENSLFEKQNCEKYFEYDVDEKISFVGFIDKILYKENEDEIIANIIDYKTGSKVEIDKDIMKYGLSLQLPSYLYLINHSKYFDKQVKYAGLYIQHLINYNTNYESEEKTLFDTKAESMKLDGISSEDASRIQISDISLEEGKASSVIKGLSMNLDGSLKKSQKLYSDNQFLELDKLVEEAVKKAGNSILNGEFNINPKEIDKKNKSCTYCKYAQICYKRPSNLMVIKTNTEEKENGINKTTKTSC